MGKLRKRRWLRLASAGMALGLLVTACASDDDDDAATEETGGGGDTAGSGGEGDGEVTISGPETGVEADGFTAAFAPFTEETGIEITYNGSRDFETQVRIAAEAGDLPDIGVIPQPGLVRDLAEYITPLPQSVLDAEGDNFDEGFLELVTVDGDVLAVPNKADLKSLVWYSPPVFEENGYEIPETFDDLLALQEQMKADGIAPWCVGIESGEATGWPLTDWFEDLMLRMHGPDVYDQWVAHEIPSNDPRVVEVGELIEEIWFTEGNVLNGRQSIAATGFAQAGLPVLDGQCGMHRQGNFYAANFADAGATFGDDGDVSTFYFPTMSDEFGQVTLVGGNYIVAFNDDPSTLAALEYVATAEYSDTRIEADAGGFLSPNLEHDTTLYSSPLDSQFAETLVAADPARFDGSDQMPSAVGSGAMWREGTNWVLGSQDLQSFLGAVEASWP